jgi:hypothetical protein
MTLFLWYNHKKSGDDMENKDNKNAFIQIRIKRDLKAEFTHLLKQNGDDVSGFLTRTIVKYVNTHKENQ